MSETRPLPLCLTMGDPAGVGPAITAAAWHELKAGDSGTFYVIGAPEAYTGVPIIEIGHADEANEAFTEGLPIFRYGETGGATPGEPSLKSVPTVVGSIALGVAAIVDGSAAGVVTNPINKALLYKGNFQHPGHTEYLAELCGSIFAETPHPIMMLVGGGLRVALATIHMPLMSVGAALSIEHLETVARIVNIDLKTRFGLPAPRLVFTGLNPHAGEDGSMGREEIDIINPAAERLRDAGIDISDARPADTVFAETLEGRYDAVIAMTHDQGLIPVKTLDLWGGVNVTLGLPIIRTSPDHGTAYDAAKIGTARPDSLIAAIRLARAMSEESAAHV